MIRLYLIQKLRLIPTAANSLIANGGPDLAASLAYYTILSLVPFMSLIALIATSFVEIDVIRRHLSMLIGIYFPVSYSFLDSAIIPLFEAHKVTGIISTVTIIWGATGLFRATNRTVNRIYGSRQRKTVGIAIADSIFGLTMIGLFLFSVVVSGLLRVALDVSQELALSSTVLGNLASHLIQCFLLAIPPLATFTIFAVSYTHLTLTTNREV